MNERTLYTISLITLLCGLIFLYFMSEEINIDTIQSLEQIPTEQTVRIAGIITKLRQAEKAYFLQVEGQETTTMDIIFFPDEDLFIEEGDYVEVLGDVEEYQGKKEVIASSIIIK